MELDLDLIQPRQDLMSHRTPGYSFREDLEERAAEREQGMLRGVSIEPLVILQEGFELMDGYTRFLVLQKYRQRRAYVGVV